MEKLNEPDQHDAQLVACFWRTSSSSPAGG